MDRRIVSRSRVGNTESVARVREKLLEHTYSDYSGRDDRPLGSYAALLFAYLLSTIAMAVVARARRSKLPERLDPADLALLTVGTFRGSRLIAKDSVTSFARAPFTRFKEQGSPGEVNEEVKGRGLRYAAGELISCPFCLAVWLATLGAFGLVVFPRTTRLVCSILAAVAGSDALQYAHAAAQKLE
jgi:hypothetical protein